MQYYFSLYISLFFCNKCWNPGWNTDIDQVNAGYPAGIRSVLDFWRQSHIFALFVRVWSTNKAESLLRFDNSVPRVTSPKQTTGVKLQVVPILLSVLNNIISPRAVKQLNV